MSLSLFLFFILICIFCCFCVGFVAVEAMDVNFVSGLLGKVNAKIHSTKSARSEEGTAGNYDHRPDEGVSSHISAESGKRKRDDTAEKASKHKKKDKRDKSRGAQSPIEEGTNEGDLSPTNPDGGQLSGGQHLSVTLPDDVALSPMERVSLPVGALKSVGTNIHDYFRRLPGKWLFRAFHLELSLW